MIPKRQLQILKFLNDDELVKRGDNFTERLSERLLMHPTNAYRTLKMLKAKGFVSTYSKSENLDRRVYYKLTKEGKKLIVGEK